MKFVHLIVFGLACTALPFANAQEKPIPEEQMVCFPDFRTTAKKSIPAVVSVKVESKPQLSQGGPQFGPSDPRSQDPFEMFGRDFFDQFFGVPRRGSPMPRAVMGQASGFLVSPDGYILTNSHVVNGADVITILLNDGQEHQAEVVGIDKNSDLAVVKIDAGNELPYLALGNSDDLEVGQWVCAVGNPLGLQASLSVGVVSAKGRNNLDLVQYEDFIQTDAMINQGNSGGPLMTLDGEVIGINTAIATSGTSTGAIGVGFAIPSNMADNVMNQLISKGSVTRGFLGIALQDIDHSLAQSFNLSRVEGALVLDVKPDTPAEKAGIQREDIILAYNGHPVTNIVSFRNAVSFMQPGTVVNLTILRADKKIELPVELGSSGETDEAGKAKKEGDLGIEVETLTPELSQQLGYVNEKGLVITSVTSGSLAAKAGIKKGALLVSVNRVPVQTPAEFKQAVESHDPQKPVLLLIKQSGAFRYVALKAK